MAAIASNGTGGGVVSAGASWAGGVAPAEGDTCTIVSGDTITIDANWTVGADSATPAIDVLNGGTLNWDGGGAADVVTCKGEFYVRNGGTLTLDGTADVTKTLTIRLNYSAALVTGKYGMTIENGSTVSITGFNKTRSWDTLAADAAPLQKNCVTTNDNSAVWYTTDAFVVGSITQKGATGAETDTIGAFAGTTITKAGANYVYKHDSGVAIVNLTRNIIITSYNTSYLSYVYVYNQTLANLTISWVRFTYIGYSSKYAITFQNVSCRANLSYCAFDHCYGAIGSAASSQTVLNISSCVFYSMTSRAISVPYAHGTVSDCVFLACGDISFYSIGWQTPLLATISGCHFSNGVTGLSVLGLVTISNIKFYGLTTGLSFDSSGSANTPSDLTLNNNTTAIDIKGSAIIVTTVSFGAVIANTTDINQSGYENLILDSNTTTLTVTDTGGKLSVADTSNNHRSWTAYGNYQKSNAIPRTGTYSMLMSPISASYQLIAGSTVPAINGTQVVVSAYFRKNNTYGSGNLPFLRLSGAGVVTDTDTMVDVNNTWQLLVVSGTPTQDGFCLVEFVAQSSGAGAAVYVDDVKMVYTAVDTGGMDYWYCGDMPPILMSTGLGATDVWAAATAGMTAAGSIGLLLVTDIDATISSRATPANITAAQAVITALLPAALVGGRMDSSIGAMANDVITAATLSAAAGDEIADALLDRINAIEAGLTPRQAMRLWSAALAGVLSGAGTNAISIRNAVANTKSRIDATVDADGNRLIVTTDTI